MRKRPQTPSRGAADIVAQIRSKVTRMPCVAGHRHFINRMDLLAWLSDWDKRARAKQGGLGKQLKRKSPQAPPDKQPWERKRSK